MSIICASTLLIRAMNDNEIDEVEALVNNIIRQNEEVATRLMTPDEAIEAGALALFGEKYGEEVRFVQAGLGREENDDAAYRLNMVAPMCVVSAISAS